MIRRYMTLIIGLLLLLVGVVACGSEEPSPGGEDSSPSVSEETSTDLPDGAELIGKMEEAIDNLDQAHFKMAFQLSKADGEQLEGSMDAWRQQPNNTRYEITSETPILNGLIIGSNEAQYWAHSPQLKALYVSSDIMGSPYLPGQPEARTVLRVLRKIQEEGGLSGNVEAVTQGTEEANSRQTYKVESTFKDTGDPETSLEGIKITFWVDQENSLPQKFQIDIEQGNVTGRASAILQGDIDQSETLDASLFTFEASGDVVTVDVDQLVGIKTEAPDTEEAPEPAEGGSGDGTTGAVEGVSE